MIYDSTYFEHNVCEIIDKIKENENYYFQVKFISVHDGTLRLGKFYNNFKIESKIFNCIITKYNSDLIIFNENETTGIFFLGINNLFWTHLFIASIIIPTIILFFVFIMIYFLKFCSIKHKVN